MTARRGGALLGAVLPPGAWGVDAFGDDVDTSGVRVGPLVGDERALVVGRGVRRAAELRTARHCARRALEALGGPSGPVLRAASGAPLWPPGVVGSITHCPGYRAAVVARAEQVPALGVDAERWRALPAAVVDAVVLPCDRAQGAWARWTDPALLACLLFSAKEAVGKAWCGSGGAVVRLRDVAVTVRPGGFDAVLAPVGGGPVGFTGRWVVARGLVVTAAVPRAAAGVPPSADGLRPA